MGSVYFIIEVVLCFVILYCPLICDISPFLYVIQMHMSNVYLVVSKLCVRWLLIHKYNWHLTFEFVIICHFAFLLCHCHLLGRSSDTWMFGNTSLQLKVLFFCLKKSTFQYLNETFQFAA